MRKLIYAIVYTACVLCVVSAFLATVCVVNGNLRAIPVAVVCIVMSIITAIAHDRMEHNNASNRH